MNTPKLKNPRTVTLVVEGERYEKFLEGLPRRKGFSESIRELMDSVIDEREKEKNLNAHNYGAIKIQDTNYIIHGEDKNLSLDLFTIERSDIPEIIREIARKPMLGKLIGNARAIIKCSQRQIDRL